MRQQTIINRLVKEWSGEYKAAAAAVIKDVLDRIKSGQDPAKAVAAAYDSSDFAAKNKEALQEKLFEAAAFAFGIKPTSLEITKKATVIEKLTKLPWAPDNMPLSKRLHGMDTTIKKQISDAIKVNLKNGTTWVKLSRELYDGYNAGHIIRTADLPAYLSRLKYYAKKTLSMGLQPDIETTYKYNKALQRAERLINSMAADGAPNRALKTAYKDLYDKAQSFSDAALDKSAYVAMQERSRFFAERIARTEIARAWTDGYIAKTYDDDLIIAYRWKLGSRHPRTDICDLNAGANMYGLGPGIYPKNSMPRQPAHPHCLCMISAVYDGELDNLNKTDDIDKAGREWIQQQPDSSQEALFGRAGAQAFQEDGDWQNYLKNWQGHSDPVRRLLDSDFKE